MDTAPANNRRHWLAVASFVGFIAHAWLKYPSEVGHNNPPPFSSHASGLHRSGATLHPGDASTNLTATPDAWTVSLSPEQMQRYRNDSAEMFHFSFQNYMQHAFPRDDLRPISCRGSNSQGGIAVTLLDSLDALVIFDDIPAFQEAVQWVSEQRLHLFNVDARVHVFEVTIRALGGLLSAHSLLQLDPGLAPDYDGSSLLDASIDLADRLIPAFDTPTGLPLSWVNLRRGQVKGDTRVTCTACAGTLLLEFGVLSSLTGNKTYEEKARHAVEYLWAKRSARGLLGNTINVDTGRWLRRDAGIGAGVDSFYEYLLKSYLAFGEPVYLEMFAESYAAAQAHLALSSPVNGVEWLVTVHMATGRLMNHFISSLAAFWPGMQALTGQVSDGLALHANWTAAWDRFGWLPESFSLNLHHTHPTMTNYPLRPELIESTFLLYSTTGNDQLLHITSRVLERLRDHTRVKCGHASIGDIGTSRLEDTMESFFLSETSKYLYLSFANATTLIDHYVLSTEGHLFPPFDYSEESSATTGGIEGKANVGGHDDDNEKSQKQKTTNWFARLISRGAKAPSPSTDEEDTTCAEVCDNLLDYAAAALPASPLSDVDTATKTEKKERTKGEISAAALRKALPHIPASPTTASLLRQRRCTACKTVSRAVVTAKKKADDLWRVNADTQQRAGLTHVAPPQWARSRIPAHGSPQKLVLCVLGEAATPGKLHCTLIKEILSTDLTSQAVQSVVHNAVFFQIGGHAGGITAEILAPALSEVQILQVAAAPATGAATAATADALNCSSVFIIEDTVPSMLAEFGPDFLPGCNSTNPALIAQSKAQWDVIVAEQKSFEAVDNEEPTEEGETEEDVLKRIAAVEKAAHGGGNEDGNNASGGIETCNDSGGGDDGGKGGDGCVNSKNDGGGEGSCGSMASPIDIATTIVTEDDSDDDPYVDPDELEAAEVEKKRKLELRKRQRQKQEIGNSNEADNDLSTGEHTEQQQQEQGIRVDQLESFHAAEAAAAIAAAAAAEAAASAASSLNFKDPTNPVVCQALGRLIPTSPYNACGTIHNIDSVHGNIAIIQRGNCSFQSKVVNAQRAGAVGAVIINADGEGIDGRSLMSMGTEASDTNAPQLPIPQIPAVMVRAQDGLILMAAAEEGRWGRMWDPYIERKLEIGSILVEEAKEQDKERKKLEAAAAVVAKAAAEKLKQQQIEGGASVPENAAADTAAAAAAALEAASIISKLELDVIVPPNSHPWVMHALYQEKKYMVLAFQQAAKVLLADGNSHQIVEEK